MQYRRQKKIEIICPRDAVPDRVLWHPSKSNPIARINQDNNTSITQTTNVRVQCPHYITGLWNRTSCM